MDPKFSDLLQSRASKKDPFAVHQLLGLVTSAFEAEEEGNDGIPLAEEASAAVSTRVEVLRRMRTSLLKETEDAIKRTTASIPKLKPRRHKAAASNANPAAAQTTDLRDTSQVLSAFYDDEAHARAQAAAQGSWVLPAEEIASLLADLPHTAPQSSLCIDISTARPHQDLDTFLQGILSGVDDDAADAATCRGAAKQEAPPSAAATLLKQHLARLEEKGVWPLVHDDDGVLEGVHQWQGGLTTLGNGGLVHGPSTGLAPLPWAPGTTHTLEVAHAVQETAAAAPAMEWPEDIAVGEEHGGKGAEPNAALKTPMTNAASGGDGPARRAVAFPQRRRVTFEDEVQELSEENRSLGASGCDPWAELETLEAWDGAANHQDEGAVLNCQDAQIEPKSNCNVMNSGRSSHPLSQLRTVPVFHKRPAMGSPVREEGPAELQSKDVHGHGLGYDPIEDADLQGHEGNGSALRAELGPSTRSSILGDDGPSACAPRPLRTVTFGKRQAVGIAGRAAPLPLMPATSTAPANDTFLLRSQGEGPEQGAPSSFEAAATAPAADGKATSPQAAEPAPAMLGDAGGATQAAVRNAISRGGGGGRRLTLDWSKPHLDPMLLRPSVLLKEWVGTKRRWRPAQRPEDLLLPPTPRTNASLQIDSAVQVNLPPLTLDASLFSRSLLTGRPIPAGTSKSLSTKGTSGDVKPYAEWLRLADKVSGVREPVGEERNASMGAPRHISATGAVNGDVPGRGAASSGQAPSKWVEDDTWWLSSDEDVEAQVAPETGVEPGCAAWFSHQHNSGQRQPRALTHQQTQFEEVPAALEIFFDDVFVQKKSSEGMDEDCDGADAYRSAVTGAQSESPEDVQLSPECEVVWDSSEGEEDEGSFLYAEIATENREEGALPAPQAVYSDGLLQVEPYSATCEAGPQVEAGDENLWNGLDSVSEGDVIFQEESEHKNLAAHARTEANPWSTGRGLFSILAAGSGALFDELEAAAEDAVECIIDGEDVDLPEEYTDGYEALHHEGNIERGAGGLGVAVIMEDDSQGSNCEAKKRSRTEESPVAQKDDVEMLGGYGVDVAFEDEQEEAWEEEHTAVRRAAVLGHRRPRAGLLNTEHIIQEWRAGQRRSAMGAQVLRPAIAQVLGAQQAQRAAGEITLGKLWALCKTKIPKDSSPSRGQFLAALLAVVHHANINADAASLHNGGVAEQATVPRSGITLCRPPGHNKAMLVKWG